MSYGRLLTAVAIGLALMPAQLPAASKGAIPRVPGSCSFTRVKEVGTRLQGGNREMVADSGSAVILENGVYGVSYDDVPPIQRSRRGDRVFTCLIRLPRNCPRGDDRGKIYTTTNLRTLESWTLPDSEHMCGGA